MERALKRAGKSVKLVIYNNEVHPYWERETQKAAVTELATFIEAHISPWSPQGVAKADTAQATTPAPAAMQQAAQTGSTR